MQNQQLTKNLIISSLQHGLDPNTTDQESGTTLLISAVLTAKSDTPFVVETLIKAGAHIDQQNNVGETALMVACITGEKEAVNILLKAGANPSITDQEGRTALIYAIQNKQPETAIIARLLRTDLKSTINQSDEKKVTPLLYAAKHGNDEIVTMLLQAGADIHAKSISNMGILMYAAQNSKPGVEKIIRTLIQAGAHIDAQNVGGQTALFYAVDCENRMALKELLAAKADPYLTGDDSPAPLLYALQKENKKIMKEFMIALTGKTPVTEKESKKALKAFTSIIMIKEFAKYMEKNYQGND